MTILRPNQKKYSHFTLALFASILIGGIFYIFQYSSFVEFRYQVKNLKKAIIEAEDLNADLSNQLYQMIDPTQLKAQAAAYHLVLEKKPEYLLTSEIASTSTLRTSL